MVQGAGDQFLAGAGLSHNQNIGIAFGYLQGQVVDLAESLAAKDDGISTSSPALHPFA